ncbi:MAG: beta-ketoacyl-ACP synthase III [Lachnospiraceae bacterium]|nr:beta-ketoacyl-ACP synthase III [Lachnospiraceae bacterium]
MTTRIIGTGSCPGDRVVTNEDLAQIVETSDEWIASRTGIRQRHLTTGMGNSRMAAEAAKRACENAGIRPEELDLILTATSTPEYCFPSTACQVQAEIGAVNAAAFDISAACTGFVFALITAESFLASGMYRTILVIGADELSKVVDWEDRKTCVLFGDGAGACVVRAEESGSFHGIMGADGSRGPVLTCLSRSGGNFLTGEKPEHGFISMDGQEVFKFAVKKVPECVNELLAAQNRKKEEVRYYILHQANERIIESVAKRLKEPIEKFPMNIQNYGNTSGASIPILLDEMNRQGKLDKGDTIVLAGFGGGLTWGAVLLTW